MDGTSGSFTDPDNFISAGSLTRRLINPGEGKPPNWQRSRHNSLFIVSFATSDQSRQSAVAP